MAHEITGIHHPQLAMPPGEEDAGRGFYGELLGLPEVPKPSELAPRGGLWFREGALEVHLGVEHQGFRPATKAHPAFIVHGLDELRERLHAADAPLCYSCGSKMQPAGSCYVCPSCGSTSGCS